MTMYTHTIYTIYIYTIYTLYNTLTTVHILKIRYNNDKEYIVNKNV